MRTLEVTFRQWRIDGEVGEVGGDGSTALVLAPGEADDVLEADALRHFVAAEVARHLPRRAADLATNLSLCLFYGGDGLFVFDSSGGWGPRSGRELLIGLRAWFDADGFDMDRPEYTFGVLWVLVAIACDDDPSALAAALTEAT